MRADIFAHNGRRSDWHPVLVGEVTRRASGVNPNLIMSGNTIKQFKVGSICLLDSKMFVPAPLAKFSSMFDLKVKKGWFPHAFNTAGTLFALDLILIMGLTRIVVWPRLFYYPQGICITQYIPSE